MIVFVGMSGTFTVETVYRCRLQACPPGRIQHLRRRRKQFTGHRSFAEAAAEAGVSSFVLISTDKAVRPTNTMGATKRLAELVLQACINIATRFCMVRFGNVLDSSGSVVPRFKKQIAMGGPITVTHPEVIRYFMTIPEAAELVIQAGSMGEGGDVFLLDMGEAVKIVDLARLMIRLAGRTERTADEPHGDIESVAGLRPGEKLYEELLIGDNPSGTEHPMIMKANESELLGGTPWASRVSDRGLSKADPKAIRDRLGQIVEGFEPERTGRRRLAGAAGQGGSWRPSHSERHRQPRIRRIPSRMADGSG